MGYETSPIPRPDLPLETLAALDGSGAYNSGWIDTGGVFTIRVAVFFLNGESGTVTIQEAAYEGTGEFADSSPRLVRTQSVPVSSSAGYAELDLTCRYFALAISSGDPDDYCSVTVRSV